MKKFISTFILLFLFIGISFSQLNVDYFINQGRLLLGNQKFKESIEFFNTAIEIKPNLAEAYFFRGVAKDNLYDFLGSEQDYTKAIQLKGNFTFAYYYRGVSRINLKKYYLAINDFSEAIKFKSIEPDFYTYRGFCRINIDQFDSAIEDFNKSLELFKKNKKAFNYRGVAKIMLKDTIGALNDYDEAIHIDPEYYYAYLNKGFLYYEKKQFDTAIVHFNLVIKYDPLNTNAYINRALSYHELKKFSNAIADLDTSLQIEPDNSIALFNRALMKNQVGELNSAIRDLDKVIQLNPQNILCYYNRAIFKLDANDYQGAFIDFSHAIEIYPDFAKAYLNRSFVRQKLNDIKGSFADKEKAEKIIASVNSKKDENMSYADTSYNFESFVTFKTSNRFFNSSTFNFKIEPEQNFALLPGTNNNSYFKRITHLNNDLFTTKNEFELLGFIITQGIDEYKDNEYYLKKVEELSGKRETQYAVLQSVYYSLLKNYNDAISTLDNTIHSDSTNFLAYFSRANIRSEMIDFIKQLENENELYFLNSGQNSSSNEIIKSTEDYFDYNLILSDLVKAKELSPDFIFCDFNIGNTYLKMREYKNAIEYYNVVIVADSEFKEAYYNRGLTYIYLKEKENGCMDMSKAGELGIESAYQVIARFCDN